MANKTLPANADICRSGGRCGDSTGYHIRGSDAHTKCTFIADNMSSAGDSLGRIASSPPKPVAASREGRKPLRALTDEESEMLEAARSAAYTMMPFYSHLLYKMNVVAADEEPGVDANGEPTWEMRAGVNRDWRLIVNFDWMRHEINKAKKEYEEKIGGEAGAEAGRWVAAVRMGKVLLHEVGHVMYDTWDLPKQLHLDHTTLNMAEDAVINGPLRQLGHSGGIVPKENIHGEFLENAVYGGSIECDDPNHSWEHTDKDGKKTRRCAYDQTTMHYYQQLVKKQKEQEESQESSGGNGKDEQKSHAYDQETDGEGKGQPGGGEKESPQKGEQASDDAGDGESGDQQPSGKGNAGGQGAPGSESDDGGKSGGGGQDPGETCGRAAAEKYEDDDFGKTKMSEAAKQVSLDMTANAIEDWAQENAERAEGMGFGSNSMARKWAESRKVPDGIKWDGLIKNVVERSIRSRKRKRATYSKPNRRATAMGTIRRGQKDGYMPSIANAIDTSGSMSADDLFMAYNSVSHVIKRTGAREVHAFAVDSTAQSTPVKIKSADDLAPLLKGGGGTDMTAGIKSAARAGHDVCIVYTDGMTPWDKMQTRSSDPDVGDMTVIVAVIAEDEANAKRWADDVPSWMKTVIIPKDRLKDARDAKDRPDTAYWG